MNEISMDGVAGAAGTAAGASGSAADGDQAFALLLSGLIQQQATSLLFSGSSDSGGLSGLSGSPFGSDTELALMAALFSKASDGGGLDPDIAKMLLSSLTGMGLSGDTDFLPTASAEAAASADAAAGEDEETAASGGQAAAAPAQDGQAIPASAWLPTSPQITGDESDRSAKLLDDVIGQFHVESSERYRPHKNGSDTYCNIFVWDVTSALGAEVPHYVDAKTGAPRTYPDVSGATELNANGVCTWLANQGSRYGWKAVSAQEAQNDANNGYPVVAAWKNTGGGAGHVQIVCPSKDGEYDSARGVSVAQAGARNYEYAYTSATLGGSRLPETKYYVHA